MSSKRKPDIPDDFFGGDEALDRLVGSRREAELVNARVEDIDPNPYNPREIVDVSELVESLREHGFMGALDGRLVGGRVQLAYGARRLKAAKEAGVTHIPVYLHTDWDDNSLLTVSLVENVQREDLTPMEAAQMLQRMNQNLKWSQQEISRRTGKSRSWVRDMLALAEAPPDVKQLVQERPEAIRHARYISSVQDEHARQELARATREERLSQPQVYQATQALQQGVAVEQALEQVLQPSMPSTPTPPLPTVQERVPVVEPEVGPGLGLDVSPEVVPEPAAPTSPSPRPQVRTKPTVQALLWAIYGRLERVSLAEVREEARDEPASLWSVIRAIERALENITAQLPAEGAPLVTDEGEASLEVEGTGE